MKKKQEKFGSNFTKLDSYKPTPDEFDEAPMLTDKALESAFFPNDNIMLRVKEVRDKTNMSQSKFAETFGFPLSTLRKWEQGIRIPTGAAISLLTIINSNPDLALDALNHKGN